MPAASMAEREGLMKISVIGGDMRQISMASAFRGEGHTVDTFALGGEDGEAKSLGAAIEGADCVILPLPCETTSGTLNAPLSEEKIYFDDLFKMVKKGALVCAGKVGAAVKSSAEAHGVRLTDYAAREEFAVNNAILTAEGAIEAILRELPVSLCSLSCLVIGFGRIGKIMAHRLRALSARVTVSARREEHFAWARAFGYDVAETGSLENLLGTYDLIVNTVPSLVLDKNRLSLLKKDCLCIDLASNPGGIDFSAAAELGVKAIWELGLPGRCAPVSAGIVIKDTVCNVLKEWGIT
ncbi:MAG: dipicolinate synthase subunit DpsA [Oscillospiraceae bacterium]|nr:dipicolinate synthase subunit DpsA [Oscillospiraceae bacterium]